MKHEPAPIVIDGQSPRHRRDEPPVEITFRQLMTGVDVVELPEEYWAAEALKQARAWARTTPGTLWSE